MSERMIELQRARLGLPPGANSQTPTPNSRASSVFGSSAAARSRLTPQQQAAAALQKEDVKLKAFLQRIQKRDDSHPQVKTPPTVPTAVSRRILQRQGVGYLDDTVASLVSAAADRFLATVLQQGVACRDQRLKGQDMLKAAAQRRRKHQMLYTRASDDRKRRKTAQLAKQMRKNEAAVEAANSLNPKAIKNAAAAAAAAATDGKQVKGKKKKNREKEENGKSNDKKDDLVDDGFISSDDSIDDEEKYYNSFYGEPNAFGSDDPENDEDEEDETRDMLLLRDLERPLEAWGFELTGKIGLGIIALETEGEPEPHEKREGDTPENGVANHAGPIEENGDAPPALAQTKNAKAAPLKSAESASRPSSRPSSVTPSATSPSPVTTKTSK